MNASLSFAAIALLGTSWAIAQNVAQEPQEDPIQAAIAEFNRRDAAKTNEVTVVLDPVGAPPAPVPAPPPAQPPTGKPAEPVLVTGKPPEGSDLVPTEITPPPASEALPEPPPLQARKGLAVRVEKLQSGKGNIDPSKVKLLAPFPAKPLAQAPAGWRLESSELAPPFTREVELSPGKKITLTVRPHLLVPEDDGVGVFHILEPGFDASLGYRQDATVGAILSHSIRQLDADTKELGTAIDNLQQLLVSLPKAETVAPSAVEPAKPATPRKR